MSVTYIVSLRGSRGSGHGGKGLGGNVPRTTEVINESTS